MNMLENKEIRLTTNEIDADLRVLRDDELDAVSGGEGEVTVCHTSVTSIDINGKGTLSFFTTTCEGGVGGISTAKWTPA
jgi:hypothetical protein